MGTNDPSKGFVVRWSSHDITLAGGSEEQGGGKLPHADTEPEPAAMKIRNKHRGVCQAGTLKHLCKSKSSAQELNVSTEVSKPQRCVRVCEPESCCSPADPEVPQLQKTTVHFNDCTQSNTDDALSLTL